MLLANGTPPLPIPIWGVGGGGVFCVGDGDGVGGDGQELKGSERKKRPLHLPPDGDRQRGRSIAVVNPLGARTHALASVP